MKILIAGLSSQSATATEVISRSLWPDASYVRLNRSLTAEIPEQSVNAARCELCVVDLLGMGWAHRTEEHEIQLEIFLAGRNAVMLVAPGSGGGWLGTAALRVPNAVRTLLQRPVSVAALREALQTAGGAFKKSSEPPRQGRPAVTPWRLDGETLGGVSLFGRAKSATVRTVGQSTTAAVMQSRTGGASIAVLENPIGSGTAAKSVGRLGAPLAPIRSNEENRHIATEYGVSLVEGGYAHLKAACPDVERNGFVKLVMSIVTSGRPHELRVTPSSGAVFHPVEGWVAANIRSASRERLLRHEIMLQTVELKLVSEEVALEQSAALFGRRQDGRRPLDLFVWALVFNAFEQNPPVAISDLRFQLHQFPNFTRLPKAYDFFLQLATVSLRAPQSIAGLQRTFAKFDPHLITLFALCALLSGMATVLPPVTVSGASHRAGTLPIPTRETARSRGLFKALLEKLF